MQNRGAVRIDQLLDDHRRVDAIIGDLEPFLDHDVAPIDPRFAKLRWTLLREVTLHHAAEQAALRSVTPRGAGPHDQGLDAALRAHMVQWTAQAIQDRWPHYRHAARLLLQRMHRQMRHEETVLFAMLR